MGDSLESGPVRPSRGYGFLSFLTLLALIGAVYLYYTSATTMSALRTEMARLSQNMEQQKEQTAAADAALQELVLAQNREMGARVQTVLEQSDMLVKSIVGTSGEAIRADIDLAKYAISLGSEQEAASPELAAIYYLNAYHMNPGMTDALFKYADVMIRTATDNISNLERVREILETAVYQVPPNEVMRVLKKVQDITERTDALVIAESPAVETEADSVAAKQSIHELATVNLVEIASSEAELETYLTNVANTVSTVVPDTLDQAEREVLDTVRQKAGDAQAALAFFQSARSAEAVLGRLAGGVPIVGEKV